MQIYKDLDYLTKIKIQLNTCSQIKIAYHWRKYIKAKKKKLEEDDTFEDCVNKVTEFKTEALGDSNLKFCKFGYRKLN